MRPTKSQNNYSITQTTVAKQKRQYASWILDPNNGTSSSNAIDMTTDVSGIHDDSPVHTTINCTHNKETAAQTWNDTPQTPACQKHLPSSNLFGVLDRKAPLHIQSISTNNVTPDNTTSQHCRPEFFSITAHIDPDNYSNNIYCKKPADPITPNWITVPEKKSTAWSDLVIVKVNRTIAIKETKKNACEWKLFVDGDSVSEWKIPRLHMQHEWQRKKWFPIDDANKITVLDGKCIVSSIKNSDTFNLCYERINPDHARSIPLTDEYTDFQSGEKRYIGRFIFRFHKSNSNFCLEVWINGFRDLSEYTSIAFPGSHDYTPGCFGPDKKFTIADLILCPPYYDDACTLH